MASIKINDNLEVNGNLTFTRTLVTNEEGKLCFDINGVLSTHLYFDDINSLETARYILNDVEVYQESFGSDDYNIIYLFKAKDIEIKGVEIEGAKFILYPEEIEKIEKEMYKNDHPVLGNIGEQYKDIVKEEDEE